MNLKHLFSLIIVISLFVQQTSLAENDKQYLLVEKNWKKLSEINKLLETGQAEEAINQLKILIPKVQSKVYDAAVIQQTLGYAYSAVNDYPAAIQAFQTALNSNALPYNVVHDIEFNLAQLLIFEKNYKEGLHYFDRWIKTESTPSRDAYTLAGTAYYESGQYEKTIPYAKNVIKLSRDYDETWHQLLLSCYQKTKQYQNAAILLEKMLRINPDNKAYWQQLLSTWQQADNDKKTLATMELMYAKGLFSNIEIKQLINMYLYLGMPFKSARLLQTHLDDGRLPKDNSNLELLGNSWYQAREFEKAANVLHKAAKLSGDGNLFYRVGQIYFNLEDYPQAISNLQTAISKGKLTQHSSAQLLLGIALFHQKNFSQSRAALEFALHNNSTKDQAEWWLQRIRELEQIRK